MQWSYSVLLHILASDPCRGYSNSSRFHARPLFDRGPCVLPAQTTVLTAEPSGPRPRRSPRWTLRPPGTQANKLYGAWRGLEPCQLPRRHVPDPQSTDSTRAPLHVTLTTCYPDSRLARASPWTMLSPRYTRHTRPTGPARTLCMLTRHAHTNPGHCMLARS